MHVNSLLERSYTGILALQEQDSLNAELVELEIQWLYILFGSSYTGIPHYSTIQGSRTVSLIDDTRTRLVQIIGENETQYRLARILNDISDHSILRISDEYLNYIEALKSDLIMGRITRPDLP